MKQIGIILLIGISNFLFSQNIELEIYQDYKRVKVSKNEATVNKSSFSLVYKFQTPFSLVLISGSDSIMQSLPKAKEPFIKEIVLKAQFGGADGYFNEDLSIKAWDSKVHTSIFYEDDEHHAFDSLYRLGKWIYGVRTITQLSTPNDYFFIEGWKQSSIVIAMAGNKNEGIKTPVLKVNFKEISRTTINVAGKEFIEVGEATFQKGCEGCGNLGSFHFLMNGKTVDYLRSGSDMISFGNYTQIGNQIEIADDISFTVSDNGKTLIDNKYKTVYTIR
jgi:hypothetical protein